MGINSIQNIQQKVKSYPMKSNNNNILTVNLRHQTDNQRISRILLPMGNLKMMSVLLCARKIGGSL